MLLLLLLLLSVTSIYSTQEPLSAFKILKNNSELFHNGPGEAVDYILNKISFIAKEDEEKQKKIEWQAQNVMPLIHPKVLPLIKDFIKIQQTHGNTIEKEVYKDMNTESLIKRLLTKRPLMFMLPKDACVLREKTDEDYTLESKEKLNNWKEFDSIGTLDQKKPFILKDYISYDEMAISALLGISAPTYFINNGNRQNRGVPGKKNSYQEEGIYTGLVGARFERENRMEFKHMLITKKQNTIENGYGDNTDLNNKTALLLKAWAKHYGQPYFPLYEEAEKDTTGTFIKINNEKISLLPVYLNINVYKKRMLLSIEIFLNDANNRAKSQNKKAYVHTVGLGLGAWAIDQILQAQLILDVFHCILSHNTFEWIANIDFSYFPEECKSYWPLKDYCLNNIHISFSNRNPADKLEMTNANKLLVAMYAWDSNSYPGNEYLNGKLGASGDPAAACCSTIAELQNPDINPFMLTNIPDSIDSTSYFLKTSFETIANYKIAKQNYHPFFFPIIISSLGLLLFFYYYLKK